MSELQILHANGQEFIGSVETFTDKSMMLKPYIIVRHYLPTQSGIQTIFSFVEVANFPFVQSDNFILRPVTKQEELGYQEQRAADANIILPKAGDKNVI